MDKTTTSFQKTLSKNIEKEELKYTNSERTLQSKKRYIIENKDLLEYKQRLSIIRIVQNDFDHIVQESGEGSYIDLDEIDNEIIDVIYNIVKTTIDRSFNLTKN